MRGYAAERVFSEIALKDFQRATALVDCLPDVDSEGRLIRCHEVVRALKDRLHPDWELEDGHYKTVNHTWLVSRRGHILDLYSVARFPVVQLFDSDIHFHRNIYKAGKPRTDIRQDVVQFLRTRLS